MNYWEVIELVGSWKEQLEVLPLKGVLASVLLLRRDTMTKEAHIKIKHLCEVLLSISEV